MWLRKSNITGKANAFIPYLGVFTILLNDYTALKFAVLGLMGLFVIINREITANCLSLFILLKVYDCSRIHIGLKLEDY